MNRRSNTLALVLVAVIVGMVGMSFAAIPLYRAFCSATGYEGTPQIGPEGPTATSTARVTVRFDASVNPNLPWRFRPDTPSVNVALGEEKLATYWARNEAGAPVTGVALYNVSPDKVGKYFHKTQCFCFKTSRRSSRVSRCISR